MNDTAVIDAPVTPDDSSGMDDLRSAFGGEPEPKAESVAVPVGTKEEAAAPSTVTTPATDSRAPSLDEVVAERVQSHIQAERAAQQRQQQIDSYQQQLNQLPDDQFGRYMRQHASKMAETQQVVEETALNFYNEATRDVIAKVPEMQKLTPAEAREVDPRQFDSFGAMQSKWIDFVATKRAEKIAERLAETKLEVYKTEQLAKLSKEYPRQPNFGSAPPGESMNFDRTSGMDFLRAAEAAGSRKH